MGVVRHDDTTEENRHDACGTRCRIINVHCNHTSKFSCFAKCQNKAYIWCHLFYDVNSCHQNYGENIALSVY